MSFERAFGRFTANRTPRRPSKTILFEIWVYSDAITASQVHFILP